MNFYERVSNKSLIKKEFLQVSFFVLLYENFVTIMEDNLIGFYANSINFESGKAIYQFTKISRGGFNSDYKIEKDKEAEERFVSEVYRTIKKTSGKYDRELSLFKWLLDHNILTDIYFEKLKEYKMLRNSLVHNLDSLLDDGFPENMEEYIKKFIEIRKYAFKMWFLEIELPTEPEPLLNENGEIIIPDEVCTNVDLSFDLLYKNLFD